MGWVRVVRCAPKRCGSVVAVVVALLLLAAPSQVMAEGGLPFGPGDRLSPTNLEHLVVVSGYNRDQVIASVKENALTYKGIQTKLLKVTVGGALVEVLVQAGIGWVLDQYGLNSGIEAQIAAIQTQLNQIQDSLNKLQATTDQLRTDLADAHFSNLVNQASTLVAHVHGAVKELDSIAHLPAADRTKRKARTQLLLTSIHTHLFLGAQKDLADRISGTAGADGLIAAAYKAELARHRLWTLRNSLQVRAVAAYYQGVEADLLMLRIEYMHARGYTATDINDAISQVDGSLQKQNSELKPDPGPDVIANPRQNHLEWLSPTLSLSSNVAQAPEFASEVGSTGLYPVLRRGTDPFDFPTVELVNVGKGWRLSNYGEFLDFIAGWSDPSGSWVNWVHRETQGLTGASWAPGGVWTEVFAFGFRAAYGVTTSGAVLNPHQDPFTHRSPFLVRTRTHNYW